MVGHTLEISIKKGEDQKTDAFLSFLFIFNFHLNLNLKSQNIKGENNKKYHDCIAFSHIAVISLHVVIKVTVLKG